MAPPWDIAETNSAMLAAELVVLTWFSSRCGDALNPDLIFRLLVRLAVTGLLAIQIAHRNAGAGANGETRPARLIEPASVPVLGSDSEFAGTSLATA